METGRPTLFSEDECRRIEQAVQAAERCTAAEIVPMIVERSGLYREARHWTGLALALCVLCALLLIEARWLPWGWHAANGLWLVLGTVAAYAGGAWLGGVPPMVRLMTSPERRSHKVRLRAERAFAQLGVTATRDRTGVLMLLSLLERQLHVIVDRSLVERVPRPEWQTAVTAAVEMIRAEKMVEGLCVGIERCGEILARACPARPGENPNELPDRPRFES